MVYPSPLFRTIVPPTSCPSALRELPLGVYTGGDRPWHWLMRYRDKGATLVWVFGFTATGLIPGISLAGSTPRDRRYTALADAEFLWQGMAHAPQYPLPPLHGGVSPALISRAIWEAQDWPGYLLNAGLPLEPSVPLVDLGGRPARCLSQGQALDLEVVDHLWEQGLQWGDRLAQSSPDGYLMLGECVVGGTTTALGVLLGLGVQAWGLVNSSHPTCNHSQKSMVVRQGLQQAGLGGAIVASEQMAPHQPVDPLRVVAAVGDPMQVVVAAMAIAASRRVGVLLAGGTQMLAVYALAAAMAQYHQLSWDPDQVVVGTTRWVAEDPTANTPALAQAIAQGLHLPEVPPLIATQLSFSQSRLPQLQMYEQGFVKEGVGAGGCAIAASLSGGWDHDRLVTTLEGFVDRYHLWRSQLS